MMRVHGYSGGMGRPPKGLKQVAFKIHPDQHKALTQAALRARLDGLPGADEGASGVVRELVQAWIDAGARWPEAKAPARRRAK